MRERHPTRWPYPRCWMPDRPNILALLACRPLSLFLLALLCLYLPLEAFDGDADVGFQKGILQISDSLRSAPSKSSSTPPERAASAIERYLLSEPPRVTAPQNPAANVQTESCVCLLKTSRLCARSRIGESTRPPQGQVCRYALETNSRAPHGA